MSDDVVAVLAEATCVLHPNYPDIQLKCESGWDKKHPECALAALAAAGYAVMVVPNCTACGGTGASVCCERFGICDCGWEKQTCTTCMTPEERLAVFKKRLQDRLALARRVLDEQGMSHVAALVPIEEVLFWLEEE